MFPITMSITVSTPAELARLVAATTNAPPAETPRESALAKAEKPADPKPSPAAASAAPPADTPATPAPTDVVCTIDHAKALTMKIVAAKGRDAAVALLKAYDVPVAAKLPADKVASFCAEAEKVLAS